MNIWFLLAFRNYSFTAGYTKMLSTVERDHPVTGCLLKNWMCFRTHKTTILNAIRAHFSTN